MKIITVTFHYATSYGAVLQAFALQQTLIGLGHENAILNMTRSSHPKNSCISLKNIIRGLFFKFTYLMRKAEVNQLLNHFSEFKKKHLILTHPYPSMEELKNEVIDVDCLITGSDQVWNFCIEPEYIDARLLNFGKNNVLKFSYAASMEKVNLLDDEKKRLSHALKSFSGISLREECVRKFVGTLTAQKCVTVLDPVFLLSQEKWNKIAIEPRYKGKYILCYQVLSNKNLPWFAKKLSLQTGLPVISICGGSFRWFNADYSFFDVSVEEFLGFFKNASYVLSASFHGVAMGLVYEKPVYAFIKENGGNRLKEIMQLFNLEKFIIKNRNEIIPFYTEDDFANLKFLKEKYLEGSYSFLNEMLNYA